MTPNGTKAASRSVRSGGLAGAESASDFNRSIPVGIDPSPRENSARRRVATQFPRAGVFRQPAQGILGEAGVRYAAIGKAKQKRAPPSWRFSAQI